MGGEYVPDYWFFDEYYNDVLDPLTRTEELVILDDDLANRTLLSRFENGLEKNEWPKLNSYYSELFADFIVDRIQGTTDTATVRKNKDRFHEFRQHVIELNQSLDHGHTRSVTTISKPAERILLKQVRRHQYDPSALDITHIDQGGGLYLLELFVTAGEQEARTDQELLSILINQAAKLGSLSESEARDLLRYPVLMVSLWDNQRIGVDHWLEQEREGILEMATATGKTVAGIAAIAHLCGDIPDRDDQSPVTDDANIMIVAHSNAILSQWEEEIADKLGLATSALSGSGRPSTLSFESGTVEFYTAQSLLPQYNRDLRESYDLVIYDEVHHYSNLDGFGKAIQRPNYEAAMGLSATIGEENDPKRRRLEEILAPVVYTYDVEDATRDGVIPDFEWTVHPTPLDPEERTEWEETTESISNQFKYLKHADETRDILKQISVPFVELKDLGDFIQAHQAAELELDRDIPDSWSKLQASIQSRNWIRHRSQPKLDGALDLAERYLSEVDRGVKVVMFAMDIDTTERIGEALEDVTENVYVVHSKIASSGQKKDRLVRERIDKFANADHGVLIAPKLLDEGIDVPDAEVGINVAGTKTKLQLVQRMGRVLRKHGDQHPHFHHFVAVPDEFHLAGLDGKHYVQELNWVRELGESIGEQPSIEEANVDSDILERAEERGHELWAQDLLADMEVETVKGSVHLDELIQDLTLSAASILHKTVSFDSDELEQSNWETAMERLRGTDDLPIDTIRRVWWLFPVYREEPKELDRLLAAIIKEKEKLEAGEDEAGDMDHSSEEKDPKMSEEEVTTRNSVNQSARDTLQDTSIQPSSSESSSTDEPTTNQGPEQTSNDSNEEEDEDEQSLTDRIRSALGI